MESKLRVLVVEDSEDDALLLVRELRKGGITALFERVDTGEAMRASLDRQDWDLILCDYLMPEFSGPAALKLVQEKGLDLPFIVVSGKLGEDRAVEMMRAGAGDYILKGNLARLLPAIEREIQEAQVRRERKEAEEALRKAHAELELKVKERTGELEEANAKLQGEIAERKRSEEALRESEERFRLMFENTLDAVFFTAPGGQFFSANPAATRMFGFAEEEVQRLGRASIVDENDPEQKAALAERARTGRFRGEVPYKRKDGTRFWGEVSDAVFHDARGEVRTVMFIRDITVRKQAEEERERLLEEVQRHAAELAMANQDLEAFTYSMAHDLRAPVRHMNGFSKELAERYADKLDERGKQYLQYVRDGSAKLDQIIDDLLALTGVTRREIIRTSVDLSQMAQEIGAMLQKEQPKRQVEFVISPGVEVDGDPGLLRIVLVNLLGNAWKFTSKRERARIEFGIERKSGKTVYCVKDNGSGFNMAFADKLFRAFERLHGADEFPGTGVGLATVERIIRRHRGSVWGEGAVGKGATFCFTLGHQNHGHVVQEVRRANLL